MGSHKEICLPLYAKDGCDAETFEKLMSHVFDTHKNVRTRVAVAQPVPIIGRVGPPPHLAVSGWQDCLGKLNKGTYQVSCLPSSQPTGCGDVAWSKLQDVFVGDPCNNRRKRALPPAYLNVPGQRFCLRSKNVGTHSVKCLPRRKPRRCPPRSWSELNVVFQGGRC